MAKIIKEYKLIYTDIVNNNNKFWNGYLYDNGDVSSEYGRVGYASQKDEWPAAGEKYLEKKYKEKIKKGYTETKTISDTGKTIVLEKTNLASIAKSQIKYSTNNTLNDLIDRLAKNNVHNITQNTNLKFDKDTGLFKSALGIITLEGINEARNILVDIKKDHKLRSDAFFKNVSKYYRLIPQDIGRFIDKDAILSNDKQFDAQINILDSLEASFNLISKPSDTGTVKQEIEKIFDLELSLLEDQVMYKRIVDNYENTKKNMHGYGNVKVRNIYAVDIKEMTNSYNNKLGNDIEVYHGTGAANILSIFKSGLKVSPPSTAFIAGKMFGNGIYGAIASSKSLGYTLGRWGNASSDYGYLFVCDFAMGKTHNPTGPYSGPPAGYDSCWAKASMTSLANDELIVYKNNQVKIKYLIEVK